MRWKPPVVCYPGTPDYQRYQWHTIDNGSFFALSLSFLSSFFLKKKMSENAGFEIERISKKVGCLSWESIYPLAAERKTDYFFFWSTGTAKHIQVQPVPNVSNKHNVSKNIYFCFERGVFFFFSMNWLGGKIYGCPLGSRSIFLFEFEKSYKS